MKMKKKFEVITYKSILRSIGCVDFLPVFALNYHRHTVDDKLKHARYRIIIGFLIWKISFNLTLKQEK